MYAWRIVCGLMLIVALWGVPRGVFAQTPAVSSPAAPAAASPTSPATPPSTQPASAPKPDDKPVFSKTAGLWGSTCWTCGFLEAANKARQIYGKRIFDLVGESMVPLLSAILGVWILLQAAQLLMPFGGMDSGTKIMTGIFSRIILAIIVLVLVRNYQIFWKINNATIDAGLEGSAAIVRQSLNVFAPQQGFGAANCGRAGASVDAAVASLNSPTDIKLIETLEESRGDKLNCSLSLMQTGFGVGMDVGIGLLMESIKKPFPALLQGLGGIPVVIGAGIVTGGESVWVLMRLAAGFVLMAVFGLAAFLMAFRFVDVIIKWTVMTVLAPVYISLFLFPKTRSIAFGGIKVMLAEAMTLIFMAIIVSVMISLFGYLLSLPENQVKTMEELSQATLKKGIGEPLFWHLLTIGLMTLGLMTQAATLAGYAMSMPGMMQLPSFGAKAADAVQSAIGKLAPQIGGAIYNRQWGQRKKMNALLRTELMKPRDYDTRRAQGRLLNDER